MFQRRTVRLVNYVTLLLFRCSLWRFLLFRNRLRPSRNILGIHVHSFFQPSIVKSPLLHVHQILLAREQRSAAEPLLSANELLLSQPPEQIFHDGNGNSSLLTRINIPEQDQVAEQHTPIRTKALNQMLPVEFLCAAQKKMRNIGAIEPFALHD